MMNGLQIKLDFLMMLLKRQRLLKVLANNKGQGFFEISLRQVFKNIFMHATKINFSDSNFIYGNAVDIETYFSTKIWGRSWFKHAGFYQSLSSTSFVSMFRLRNNLFFQKNFLKNINYIFLFFCNLRYESPLLNLLLKQWVKTPENFIFNLGASIRNTYTTVNLGGNLTNFFTFLKGRQKISSYLLQKKGLFLLGNNFVSLIETFSRLPLQANLTVVPAFSSFLNAAAVNSVSSYTGILANKRSLSFYVQTEYLKADEGLNIFFGSHGCR